MSSELEERHSISDPRIHYSETGLAWEVQIYRKGVTEAIDTVIITHQNMPPRLNKKGKVLWVLPNEPGKLPSFGAEEKRRIFEIFKEQKKTRKKIKAHLHSNTTLNQILNDTTTNRTIQTTDEAATTTSAAVASLNIQDTFNNDNPKEYQNDDKSNKKTTNSIIQPPPGLAQDLTQCRFITIPQLETIPYPNKANTIAQALVNTYYPYLHNGLHSLLATFYTQQATKSVSIHSAYSTVTGRDPIALQLASLSSMTFTINGIIPQDTIKDLGAHVLITGTVAKDRTLPSSNDPFHRTTYFAQSFIVVTATQQLITETFALQHGGHQIPFSFQIHNDSLTFFIQD